MFVIYLWHQTVFMFMSVFYVSIKTNSQGSLESIFITIEDIE